MTMHDHNHHTEMDDYELEFLIEGHHRTFTVIISSTANVQRLGRLIYQEGGFHGIRHGDLMLLQVCHYHNSR